MSLVGAGVEDAGGVASRGPDAGCFINLSVDINGMRGGIERGTYATAEDATAQDGDGAVAIVFSVPGGHCRGRPI